MSEAEDALRRVEELHERLVAARAELDKAAEREDPDAAVDILTAARETSRRRSRPSCRGRARGRMRPADELRELVETALAELVLTPELGGLREPMRYAYEAGGKRVRPVLCLATAESAGASGRRGAAGCGGGRARAHVLARARRPAGARRRRRAPRPAEHARRLRRGRRPARRRRAADRGAPARPAVPEPGRGARADRGDARHDRRPVPGRHRRRRRPRRAAPAQDRARSSRRRSAARSGWPAFRSRAGGRGAHSATSSAPLFQIVDDLLDGDGYAARLGEDEARRLAGEAADRAHERLERIEADTTVLHDIVDVLAVRTA